MNKQNNNIWYNLIKYSVIIKLLVRNIYGGINMKKKVIGLLLLGIVIILIVVLISVNPSKKTNNEKKKVDENTHTCIKIDNDNENEEKQITHIIKLKDVENNNENSEDNKQTKDIDTYITINEYKFKNKNDYEKKCYETKIKENYTNSSKDIDFKEKATCNNKKKLVSVKDIFVISKLSKAGRKSLDKVLKYQENNKFDINSWLKSEKEDNYSCK